MLRRTQRPIEIIYSNKNTKVLTKLPLNPITKPNPLIGLFLYYIAFRFFVFSPESVMRTLYTGYLVRIR